MYEWVRDDQFCQTFTYRAFYSLDSLVGKRKYDYCIRVIKAKLSRGKQPVAIVFRLSNAWDCSVQVESRRCENPSKPDNRTISNWVTAESELEITKYNMLQMLEEAWLRLRWVPSEYMRTNQANSTKIYLPVL